MRTLEWIIADNERICRENNAATEAIPNVATEEEALFLYKKYGECVAKFTCDLQAVIVEGTFTGWGLDKGFPQEESMLLLTNQKHYDECEPCRMALLAHRVESLKGKAT